MLEGLIRIGEELMVAQENRGTVTMRRPGACEETTVAQDNRGDGEGEEL